MTDNPAASSYENYEIWKDVIETVSSQRRLTAPQVETRSQFCIDCHNLDPTFWGYATSYLLVVYPVSHVSQVYPHWDGWIGIAPNEVMQVVPDQTLWGNSCALVTLWPCGITLALSEALGKVRLVYSPNRLPLGGSTSRTFFDDHLPCNTCSPTTCLSVSFDPHPWTANISHRYVQVAFDEIPRGHTMSRDDILLRLLGVDSRLFPMDVMWSQESHVKKCSDNKCWSHKIFRHALCVTDALSSNDVWRV